MLHRFVEAINEVAGHSGFDVYYSNLRRRGLPGGPTRREALREYRAFQERTRFSA